jgi:hypothetical protein
MSGAGPLSFSVGPFCEMRSPQELLDWLDTAKISERFTYATGRVYPRKSTVVAVVTALVDQRRVLALTQKRPDGQADYMVQMARVAEMGATEKENGSAELKTSDGEPVGDAMLRLIKRCANLGMVAPSLEQLRVIADLPSISAARYQLQKLEKLARVRIHTDNNGHRRMFVLDNVGGIAKATASRASHRIGRG